MTPATQPSSKEIEDVTSLTFGWRNAAVALLLVTVAALAYSNAFTNQFIGIDTKQYVRDNPDIRSLTPLTNALSLNMIGPEIAERSSSLVRRPTLSLSFALNYAILGPEAWGFQAVNVAIHTAAAFLLFGIVRRTLLFKGYASDQRARWLSFAIAAIWVAHPLQTESVVSIVQRAESQMGFFALLTLYCSIRSWQSSATAAARGRHSVPFLWSASAVLACALGMGTKEIMLVVPVLVWLYDAILVSGSFLGPLRHRPGFYVALSSTWCVLGILIALTLDYSAQDFQPGRLGPYILSQPHVIMHYLRVAVWPHPLFHYILGPSFWFHPGADSWFEFLHYAIPLAILGLGVLWAALRFNPFGFLGAWFFLPLLATSLVATHNVVQEHRMYLSLAAIVVASVLAVDAAVARAASRLQLKGAATTTRVLLLVLVLTALIFGTRFRNRGYESELTVWAPEDRLVAFSIMSGIAVNQGKFEEAAEALETLLQAPIDGPQSEPPFAYRVRALNALGCVRTVESRWDEAQQLFVAALERDPSYAVAESNFAALLFLRGDRQAAQEHFRRALSLNPNIEVIHFNYGMASLADGNEAEAVKHLARQGEGPLELVEELQKRRALGEGREGRSPLRLSARIAMPAFDEPLALNYFLIFSPEQ